MIPEKVYVHPGAHLGMLTLTTIPVDAPGEEIYIRKNALIEWANNWEWLGQSEDFVYAMKILIQHLNSM